VVGAAIPGARNASAIVPLPSAPIRAPSAANYDLPVLTRVLQVRELSPREAAQGYPVHITGVVTFSSPEMYMQFLNDDSTGIYLALDYLKSDIRPETGQSV